MSFRRKRDKQKCGLVRSGIYHALIAWQPWWITVAQTGGQKIMDPDFALRTRRRLSKIIAESAPRTLDESNHWWYSQPLCGTLCKRNCLSQRLCSESGPSLNWSERSRQRELSCHRPNRITYFALCYRTHCVEHHHSNSARQRYLLELG